MVAQVSIDAQNQTAASGPQFGTSADRLGGDTFIATSDPTGAIIDQSREADFSRNVITWKTPLLGYVRMYINPQEMTIADKKISQTTRTKAGFVYQYAGEDLTRITIRGTTGSAGMEGINVLQTIYRSEQSAFNGIAAAVERRLQTAQVMNFVQAVTNVSEGASPLNSIIDASLTAASSAITNIFNQPFPTLASLAANVEMTFQGVTYRGYFESFDVIENAASPGLFEYNMSFTAYAKQGFRRNFMPWHKQPFAPADSNGTNPYSFFSGNITPAPTAASTTPQNNPTAVNTATAQISTRVTQNVTTPIVPTNPTPNFTQFASNFNGVVAANPRITQVAASGGKSSITSLI